MGRSFGLNAGCLQILSDAQWEALANAAVAPAPVPAVVSGSQGEAAPGAVEAPVVPATPGAASAQ